MLSSCGTVAVLSIIVHFTSGQEVKVENSTDGYLVIREGLLWNRLALPITNVSTLKVLCRNLGLESDDVIRLRNYQQPTFDNRTSFMNINCIGNETSIDECPTATQESPNLNSSLVRLHCRGLSFSLTGGGDRDGLVVARHNGQLVPVCRNFMDAMDGAFEATVCKDLGFNVSHPLVIYPYKYTPDGREITQALKLELHCHGEDCELHTTNTDEYCVASYGIFYLDLVAVFCVEQRTNYSLQDTIEDQSRKIGRLAIWANNTWGPVCQSAGGLNFAENTCKAMGLPSAGAQDYTNIYTGGEFEPGSLTMNYCEDWQGTCRYNLFGMPCRDEGYLGISCADATEGDVRLYRGDPGLHSGQVQIYHNGTWNGVGVDRSRSSGLKEAVVVCRTLNLSTNGVDFSYTRRNHSVLWVDNIYCDGDESTVLQCNGAASLDQIENKARGRAFSVSCGTRDTALRLEDNGLLMMKQNGLWGTVCANSINNLDAAVICKALNKPYTLASSRTGSNQPQRTDIVWKPNFKCTNINDKWQDCLSTEGFHSLRPCTHDNDVYIKCADVDNSTLAYRLVNGPKPNIGYLEMFVNNTWGYVCKTGMTEREAKVVCRSMNFPTKHAKVINSIDSLKLLSSFNNTKRWISSLTCTGSEANILDCDHSYLGDGYCTSFHGQLAVYCGTEDASDNFRLRIAGKAGTTSGRLEVKLFGEWGTICDTNFDDNDAETACRQLGLPYIFAKVADKGSYSPGSGRIWMSGINCYGFETNFANCKFPPVSDFSCSHSHDVGVNCKDSLFSFDYRVMIGATIGSTTFVLISGIISMILRRRSLTVKTMTPSAHVPPTYAGKNGQTLPRLLSRSNKLEY